jgi:hypothetical protein
MYLPLYTYNIADIQDVTDKSIIERIIQSLCSGNEARSQVEVKLKKGTRIHMLNGLKVLDPVTGGFMIIIYEEGILL